MEDYRYKLDVFEGPLDLLLHLIEKHKLDIYDIPIVDITSQYMDYLENWQFFDIDYSSEFVVMAATLLQIKSRMLLPRQSSIEESEEDPRDELVSKLLEFKEIKAFTELIEKRTYLYDQFFARPEELSVMGQQSIYTLEISELFKLFKESYSRPKKIETMTPLVTVEKESFSLSDKIKELKERIKLEVISFRYLISESRTKEEAVVYFLAILELLKFQIITIKNKDSGNIMENSDIYLIKNSEKGVVSD